MSSPTISTSFEANPVNPPPGTGRYMPYDYARGLAEQLRDSMGPYCERIEIAGSIRRRKPEGIKDIEIVAVPIRGQGIDPPDLFGERTVETNALYREWAMKPACPLNWIKPAVPGVVPWHPIEDGRYWRAVLPIDGKPAEFCPKVDVFLTQPERWGATLIIRTGSKEFNAALLKRARQCGYEFREGELYGPSGCAVDVPEERDVFRVLRCRWVQPWARTGPEWVVPQ